MFSANKVRASITDRDPVFNARYIGSVETFVASGKGCTNRPVQKLWDNAGSERNLKRVTILINTNGLLMKDTDKKKDEGKAFSIINISYCNAESDANDRIFSWICKDENSPTLTIYAVLCSSKEKAKAMSLVLSRAFQIAYIEWKKLQVREEREHRKEKVKEKISKKSDSVSDKSFDGSENGSITESSSTEAVRPAVTRRDSECQTEPEVDSKSDNAKTNTVSEETYLQPVSKEEEYACIDHKIMDPKTEDELQKDVEVQAMMNGDFQSNDGTSGDDGNCIEFKRCWSMYNQWICLKPDQICDGINECYDGHDEYFCSLCTSNCSIDTFETSCAQRSLLEQNTVPDGISEFLNWSLHPLSKILPLQKILQYDCSISLEMNTVDNNHLRHLSIVSIYHWHKIRQVVLSTLFKDLTDVLHVSLMGKPMLSDIDREGIWIFKNVETMTIGETDIVRLSSWIFTPKLRSLTLFDNIMLNHIDEGSFLGLDEPHMLSITGSNLRHLGGTLLKDLRNLTFLNLSSNNIQILGKGFLDNNVVLGILDITRNDIKLTSNYFCTRTY